MKSTFFLFQMLMASMMISCNSIQEKQQSENDKLLKAYIEKQKQIDIIQYNVLRVDTLITGKIRHSSGDVIIERNQKDTIHGISFYANSDSSEWDDYYVQYTYYEVKQDVKFCKKEANFQNNILRTLGGQLIVGDLLNLEISDSEFSINRNDTSFELKIVKANESSILTKCVIVDTKTLIPHKIFYSENDKAQKLRYSSIFSFNNILINDQVLSEKLDGLDFYSRYSIGFSAIPITTYKLIGNKVPEIIFQTFNNERISIRSLESQLVLLDYWEWWCGPCIKSLPKVNKIAISYKPFGLTAIGIASDDPDRAQRIIENENLDFVQAIGNEELKEVFEVNSFPRYVLIDQKGIIRKIYHGFYESIELDINELLMQNE